jgi:fumarate hydratase class II
MSDYKILNDSMGEMKVPANALWGAQTQRAVENFPISGIPLPSNFLQALAHVKFACAGANMELGLMSETKANAIQASAERIIKGEFLDQFPLDIFQTGSATSSNMNMNEVIASLASEVAGEAIHPNDDVNMSQSSMMSSPQPFMSPPLLDCRKNCYRPWSTWLTACMKKSLKSAM